MDWASVSVQIREHYGWSQSEFAAKLSVAAAMVSQIESGIRNPSVKLRATIRKSVPDESVRKAIFGEASDADDSSENSRKIGHLEGRIEELEKQVKRYEAQIERHDAHVSNVINKVAELLQDKKTSEKSLRNTRSVVHK
jgi:transcriptional regulator with XRE-family HTH domain